jgi:hypothetical protein
MKPAIHYLSQLRSRKSANRMIRLGPVTKLNFSFQPVRFGLKPKITIYECETNRVQVR